jgi:ribonuclease VapC
MVIDSSALLAILLDEPESEAMLEALEADPNRLLCAVHLLETAIVIEARKGPAGGRELDLLLHRASIQVVNLTEELAERAREAWRKWGKGNHSAGLNYCDCCAYALAEQMGEPLLFKGEDFRRTGLRAARLPSPGSEDRGP